MSLLQFQKSQGLNDVYNTGLDLLAGVSKPKVFRGR